MRCGKAILGLVFLSSLPSVASAQTREVLLEQGSTVLGMGSVSAILATRSLRITDTGLWTSFVQATGGNGNTDNVLLRSGFMAVREAMLFASPPGSTIDEMDAVDLTSKGDFAMALRARIPDVTGVQESIAWNLKVIAREPQEVQATHPFLPLHTAYTNFEWVKVNEQNTLLTYAEITAPPGNTPQKRQALIKFQIDGFGNLLSTTIVGTRGQPIPGMGNPALASLGQTESNFAMNNKGDVLCYIQTSGGNAVVLNMDVPLAQTGTPSPVAGRNWGLLNQSRVALNDFGEYALSGALSGATNAYLIVKNGQKFAQQGDIIPAFSPNPIGGGSGAPIALTNSGDLFWRVVENDSDTAEAFMRNNEPIVQRGVTTLDGRTVTKLEVHEASFAVSPNGRFFVGCVDLGGEDALVFIDFGLVLELPGCHGNTGKLSLQSGGARVGANMVFEMDDGNFPGALARIQFSTRRNTPGECGLMTPFGEWMISIPHRVGTLFPPPWNGTDPTAVGTTVPANLALVDAVFYAQGLFQKPGTTRISLTNALRIEIGAP